METKDIENTLVDTGKEEGEWKEQHENTYTTTCETDSQWVFAVWLRALKLGLWDNLEDGRGGRWEGGFQEGGKHI